MTVLPWAMWGEAASRAYPYGTEGFIILTVVAITYLVIMWVVGLSFLRAYRLMPSKVEYKYFAWGILTVATFDTLHVIGDILFYVLNDSRVPISLGPDTEFYYLPFATSLSVMGIFIFYIMVYTYSIRKIGELTLMDKIFYVLAIIGILMGLNPYNWWHIVPPSGTIDTKPITGTFLIIIGLLAVYKFYVATESSVGGAEDPTRKIRLKFVRYGIFLMVLLVFLMVPHGMLASIDADWARTLMIVITVFKLASLGSSAIMIYIGVVWPKWAERRFAK